MSEQEAVVIEKEEEEVVVEEPVFTEEELHAMDHGWAPKDQWKGDEDDWVNAKEFNRRGELFGKIKILERDRDSLRQATAHMKDLLAKAQETEFKRAMRELKAEKRQAADEGETSKMLEIDDKIEELQADQQAYERDVNQVNTQPQINEAFIAWQNRNQWYVQDADMRMFADTAGLNYAQQNPSASPEDVFKVVDKQIRKAYPEKFDNPRRNSPPKVESSTTNVSDKSSKSKYTAKDLNEEQRSIMKTMTRSGIMTEEEYINELARIGEIG